LTSSDTNGLRCTSSSQHCMLGGRQLIVCARNAEKVSKSSWLLLMCSPMPTTTSSKGCNDPGVFVPEVQKGLVYIPLSNRVVWSLCVVPLIDLLDPAKTGEWATFRVWASRAGFDVGWIPGSMLFTWDSGHDLDCETPTTLLASS